MICVWCSNITIIVKTVSVELETHPVSVDVGLLSCSFQTLRIKCLVTSKAKSNSETDNVGT